MTEVSQAPRANDIKWMNLAYEMAQQAEQLGEVPVGAVLVQEGVKTDVKNDQLIAQACNQPISQNDPSAHAEIAVMRLAGQTLDNYRLNNTTLYVTLEPCIMCLGAIVHARVGRLVYGASDPRSGAIHSAFDLLEHSGLNHRFEVTPNVLAEPCSKLLSDFFKKRR